MWHRQAGSSYNDQRVVAGSELSLILLGETGVGKELTAHAIHRASPRARGPFVSVNCTGLSDSQLESDLFGYEEGAFPEATTTTPGLIELADGGTLFLDGIADAPLTTQAKLLKTLESREVRRMGAVAPRRVDVRVLAATNACLVERVKRGHFRRDLYDRLNGFTLHVPPLRARREAILPLAAFFAEDAAPPGGSVRISSQAAALLLGYPFPGNVRELRTIIERAVLLSGGKEIQAAHLCSATARSSRS